MVYYSKYPFSKEAENKLRSMTALKMPMDELYATKLGKTIFDLAVSRIRCSLFKEEYAYKNDIAFLLSYFIAKVILYNTKHNNQFIKKFIKYETNRVYKTLKNDEKINEIDYNKIVEELSLIPDSDYIPLGDYLALKKYLEGDEYKLVNRIVKAGMVNISDIDKDLYCKSKINSVVTKDIDNSIKMQHICDMTNKNSNIKEIINDITITLYEDYQLNIRTNYGEIENDHFPPCMNAILYKIENNINVAHHERFFMVAFLKEVGMSIEEIILLFSKSPKFNYNQTAYQIRHIIGEENSEKYVVPACATAKTYGYCNCGDNKLCTKVKHPLGFYIVAKKKIDHTSYGSKRKIISVKDELPTTA